MRLRGGIVGQADRFLDGLGHATCAFKCRLGRHMTLLLQSFVEMAHVVFELDNAPSRFLDILARRGFIVGMGAARSRCARSRCARLPGSMIVRHGVGCDRAGIGQQVRGCGWTIGGTDDLAVGTGNLAVDTSLAVGTGWAADSGLRATGTLPGGARLNSTFGLRITARLSTDALSTRARRAGNATGC